MSKIEFLEKLGKALGNDLSAPVVQGHVRYYSQYISDEVAKGRSEKEVIEELGDPWAIARNIIDVEANKSGSSRASVYEDTSGNYSSYGSEASCGTGYDSAGDSLGGNKSVGKWSLILFAVGVIAVLVLIIAIIGGIISFLAPIIIPILVIVLLIQLIRLITRGW